jgi:hypothetical protein
MNMNTTSNMDMTSNIKTSIDLSKSIIVKYNRMKKEKCITYIDIHDLKIHVSDWLKCYPENIHLYSCLGSITNGRQLLSAINDKSQIYASITPIICNLIH